ncbi:DNA recombination protein RmuC [Pelagibaculum spongiae]|uniref:DNA recombination protein RmuC n=1 Tax=Pelagibaculum spongiae TaxID=2080658 RepID=A0A2V1GXZ8_9GAMM|nr:DNA recombination protein RmuC [Pelagibaculum spongiae]PVZ71964.1 DNA recombination protein RmuC [Pelagibaculum spongiae]
MTTLTLDNLHFIFIGLSLILLISSVVLASASNKNKALLSQAQLAAQRLSADNLSSTSQLQNLELETTQTISTLHAQLEHARQQNQQHNEQLIALEKNKQQMNLQFENLAQKIFEEKGKTFTEKNQSSMDALLAPFKEQLSQFKTQLDQSHHRDNQDRASLREQVSQLMNLNQKINQEAINLTRALKSENKTQGNWGELVLEKVLEKSGLRKGEEYQVQESFKDDSGSRRQPDVIIRLPEGKDVIIDSKVSLTAYQKYISSEDQAEALTALKAHVESVRRHIRQLSDKDYSQLSGLNSLDFVLMFMPIEPAFVAAFQHDPQLFTDAFDQKIIVVTPTTLLATLRTIENIWRYERQNQNAIEIAEQAGKLYDKLRVFCEKMEKTDAQLTTARNTFDDAMNSLSQGRGNLIAQAGKFLDMGVRVKKQLPKTLTDKADPSE